MKKLQELIAFLMIASLIQGCATAYRGPFPNENLRGEPAKKEYEKFKLEESFWTQGRGTFSMGEKSNRHTYDSLEPMMKYISPRSVEKVETAQKWDVAQVAFLGVMLVLAGIRLSQDSDTDHSTVDTLYYSSAGVGLACGVVAGLHRSKAASYFNEDLRSRLHLNEASVQVSASLNY